MHRTVRIDALEGRTLCSLNGEGLTADYFQDMNLTAAATQVVHDRPFHQSAANVSPVPGVDPTSFSVAWNGLVTPLSTGSTRFYVRTDGGVRVWVNHTLVLDDWNTLNKQRDLKGSINLTQGQEVTLHVDYRHDKGASDLEVRWQTDSLNKQLIPLAQLRTSDDAAAATLDRRVETALAFAKASVKQTMGDLKPGSFPDRVRLDTGKWETTSATSWVSGYFGGTLWALDKAVGGFTSNATAWTTPLASTASLPGDHFGRIWATYKPLYDSTHSSSARDVLLKAARSKASTWSKKVKAFQTRDIASSSGKSNATFGVLMDQTMDMQLLLWAADQNNDTELRSRVIQHMKTVAKNMVRSDGSIVQRGFFDGRTGALVSLENYQGLNNSSTWSRGQAWAINSFSTIAGLTGDATLLATAQRVASYFVDHLPSDHVPQWDFAATPDSKGKAPPRDSSAAAIAAGGLYTLSKLLNEPTTAGEANRHYRDNADAILSSLTSPRYMVYGQTPAKGVTIRGILAKGSSNVPKKTGVEVPQTYGDYYLLQAIAAYRA